MLLTENEWQWQGDIWEIKLAIWIDTKDLIFLNSPLPPPCGQSVRTCTRLLHLQKRKEEKLKENFTRWWFELFPCVPFFCWRILIPYLLSSDRKSTDCRMYNSWRCQLQISPSKCCLFCSNQSLWACRNFANIKQDASSSLQMSKGVFSSFLCISQEFLLIETIYFQ